MGFLCLVLYPLRPPPLTHSLPPSLPPSLTHSLTHPSLTQTTLTSLTSLTHITLSLSHSLTHSHITHTDHTHSTHITHSHHSLSLTHSLIHSLSGRRGTMCTAKGLDVRPGVPWGSAAFAWQAWDNVHCQGVGCTPWRPLGLRLFCVAGVGQCALPRGRMYALASLGAPRLLRAKGSDVRPGVP